MREISTPLAPTGSRRMRATIQYERMFVLHADADAFFASVEQRDDPRLRGRPVIVGGGVVLAASYEAKAYGIRRAMGGRQARRLCPDAIVVPPRFSAYTEASRAMFAVFEDASPVVEGLSIDEAFLDVRGMERIAGSPVEIAVRLRAAVRERVGLPVTVGVARTKFLAKVASGVAKPDGLLVVPPERELAFLHPLPVECVWGVGPATARRLQAWNVRTVGELAALSEHTLVAMLGRAAGRQLSALAHNRDFRRVEPGRRRGSIGSQRALGRGRHSAETIDAALVGIVDRITRRLRAARRGRPGGARRGRDRDARPLRQGGDPAGRPGGSCRRFLYAAAAGLRIRGRRGESISPPLTTQTQRSSRRSAAASASAPAPSATTWAREA